MADLITRESGITEILQKFPSTEVVFQKHGIHCVGCMLAAFENIEQGAGAHGLDIELLLKDLNEVASKEEV